MQISKPEDTYWEDLRIPIGKPRGFLLGRPEDTYWEDPRIAIGKGQGLI